ncbi:hypothetical protein HLB16_19560, partial [Cupriavidus gilardii]|nr:hypothetical protein [Cupriavidus gilardii]
MPPRSPVPPFLSTAAVNGWPPTARLAGTLAALLLAACAAPQAGKDAGTTAAPA